MRFKNSRDIVRKLSTRKKALKYPRYIWELLTLSSPSNDRCKPE